MTKIYIVLKNADFTEGRGPMLFHTAFSCGTEAIEYVKNQHGIFGSKQYIDRSGSWYYADCNGYAIDEVNLFNSYQELVDINNEDARQKALKKLTDKEKKLLGL